VLCSVCGCSAVLSFHIETYPVFQCRACQHRFTRLERPLDEHLATTYSDAYFTGGGAGYPSYLDAAPVLAKQGKYYCELLARFGVTSGHVLDVGCAAGLLLEQFVRCGWQGLGLEPNATLAAFGRSELGLDIINASIEEFGGSVPAGPFTLVLMIQVLAHLADPRSAFAKAVSKLQEGGHVLIETWDHQSRTARLFGRRWHEYSPPSVLQWFCRRSLLHLLVDHGLRVLAWGRPNKRLQWRHAQSLVEYKLPRIPRRVFKTLAAAAPGNLEIPYPGDDVLWVIAQKPPDQGAPRPASPPPVAGPEG
jgi:2-polyprenyl-3-methyl-5-hydroxy-6-metoxy-1,4-benzoquinol methylase